MLFRLLLVQRPMDDILPPIKGLVDLVYLDDVIIFSQTVEE